MELTFKDLKKRDVINIADGRSLGRITDLRLNFPKGVLTGIYVPGKKNGGLLWFLDKNSLFIEEANIVKIGGDVILVNLKRGDVSSPAETPALPNEGHKPPKPKPCPPCDPCPPLFPSSPCTPICPPPCNPCAPPCPPCDPCQPNPCGNHHGKCSPCDAPTCGNGGGDNFFYQNTRIDLGDY